MVIQRQAVVPTQLLIAGISELAGKLLFMAGFNKLKQKQGDFCQPGSLCLLQAGQGAVTLESQQSEGINPDPHPRAPTILQWKLKPLSMVPYAPSILQVSSLPLAPSSVPPFLPRG